MLSHGQGLSSTLHLGFVSAATQPCLLGFFQHVHSCNMSFSFWSSCSAALGSEMRLGTLPPPLQAQAGQTWNSANRLETLTKRWQHKMNWWISDEYVMNIWWICDECRSTCTHSRQVVIMMPVVQSPCSTALCAAAARPGMHTRSYEKQQRGTKIAVACKRLWNKECMILGGYHKRPPKCVSFVQLYANCSFHKRVPCSLSFAAFAWLWFCQEAWSFERVLWVHLCWQGDVCIQEIASDLCLQNQHMEASSTMSVTTGPLQRTMCASTPFSWGSAMVSTLSKLPPLSLMLLALVTQDRQAKRISAATCRSNRRLIIDDNCLVIIAQWTSVDY